MVTAGVYLLIRSSPILEYSSNALLVITLVGALTAFIGASSGLVQNDIKRIIAFSTISQLGLTLDLIFIFIFIFIFLFLYLYLFLFITYISFIYLYLFFNYLTEYGLILFIIPIKPIKCELFQNIKIFTFKKSINNKSDDRSKSPSLNLDNFSANFHFFIENKLKFTDFSFNGKKMLKRKLLKIKGIYLFINSLNNKSYVGKSNNLYVRLTKYFSSNYLNSNKNKMAICAAILKYGINNFKLYILEIIENETNLSEKENYWYKLIKPSYNIQSILDPFKGENHYRFGKTLPNSIKLKISNTLKGKILTEEVKLNHIKGANKKSVYCYDWDTNKFLMKFEGIRIMMRALNFKNIQSIRVKLDICKPFNVTINNVKYKMLLLSKPLTRN